MQPVSKKHTSAMSASSNIVEDIAADSYLLHTMLEYCGAIDTSNINLVASHIRSAVHQMSQTMLDNISSKDIKLLKTETHVQCILDPSLQQNKQQQARISESAPRLRILSTDEACDVRLHVARNVNTPKASLQQLATHQNIYIRQAIAKNQNTPTATLRYLAATTSFCVQRAVAENQNTPLDILLDLARNQVISVRVAVTKNKHISIQLLQTLKNDDNPTVRRAAAYQLAARQTDASANLTSTPHK